jgi:hypothetical protein
MGEQPSWRARLDELELPPESDGTFRDGTWERLYVRLQEKQQPRRIFGYWAAAVCLVLAGILSFLLLQHGRGIRSHGPVPSKEFMQAENKPGPLPVVSSTAVTSPTLPAPGRSSAGHLTETQPDRTPGQYGRIQEQRMKSLERNQQQFVLMETSPAPITEQAVLSGDRSGKITDSINLAGVKLPNVQRKLRVVHINELEEPEAGYEPAEDIAGKSLFFLHHLPVNNSQANLVGQEQSIPSPGTGIAILFKISPQK